jgi:hypothetical protein
VTTPLSELHPLEVVAEQLALTRKTYSLHFERPVAVKVFPITVAEVQTLLELTGESVYSTVYPTGAEFVLAQLMVAEVLSELTFPITGEVQGTTTGHPLVLVSLMLLHALEEVVEQLAFTRNK